MVTTRLTFRARRHHPSAKRQAGALPRNQTFDLALRLGILSDFFLGQLAPSPAPRQRVVVFVGETVRARSSGRPAGADACQGVTGTSW
jgi:hypothetical protein